MRLTTVLLIASLVQVSAAGFAQKLTFNKKGTTLFEVFKQIKVQTGYNILYQKNQLKSTAKIDVNFKDEELKVALDRLASENSFEYQIDNKNISIKVKEPSFLDRLAERWASIDVRGRVVDAETGQALAGASVKVKGSSRQTNTNAQGNFYLQNVNEDAVIEITFVGYLGRELKAEKDMGTIKLTMGNSELDAVQVIAYGTTTRRTSTSNIGSVKSEAIERQPVTNPLLALQGRVPGLYITQSSGVPGSEVSIMIQGKNSINSGNDPFFVVDGVPFSSKLLPGPSSLLGNNASPFTYLNPADIESIEVLKDASATAIYGSRAANGAILITTKKGKAGKPQGTISFQQGWGKVARQYKMLNSQEYMQMRREAKANDNLPLFDTDSDLKGHWDTTRYTNWQKELVGKTALYTNAQASLSGGTEENRFMANAGYSNEGTPFLGNSSDKKIMVGFNFQHTSMNKKFNLSLSANYMDGKNILPNADLMNLAIRLAPVAPNMYNEDGSINWQLLPNGSTTFEDNPAAKVLGSFQIKTQNLITSSTIGYEILKGLSLKSSFMYNSLLTKDLQKTPITTFAPNLAASRRRSAIYTDKSIKGLMIEPRLEYKMAFGFGNIDVLLGSSYQENQSYVLGLSTSGHNSDAELDNPGAAPNESVNASIQTRYRYNALFGRVSFSRENKYFLNLDARRDGSSRFGPANRFQNFYGIGAAWIFSEESFWKRNFTFFNYGKLRASYGTTGNDQIGDYAYLNLFSPITVGVPYQGAIGIVPAGHANPYIQWELTRKFNLGLDMGFVSNRILLDINYYINRSSNQLLISRQSAQTGFARVSENFAATVQNSGLELSLNTVPVQSTDFRWSSNFNLTLPKNKLVAFPGLSTSIYASTLEIGRSITSIKVFRFAGVNQQTGVYEFYNADGNIIANPTYGIDDIVPFDAAVKHYGGWGNTITYKGLELDFLLQFANQKAQSPFTTAGNPIVGFMLNQPAIVLDRWRQPGDIASIQKSGNNFNLVAVFSNATASNKSIVDASYLSIKNFSLSYNLPVGWVKKTGMTAAKVFVLAQNLYTFTKFDGLNPEVALNSASTPPLRMISAGLRITL